MRRTISRDKGHAAIVGELKALGYSVGDMAGAGNDFPDLVVSSNKATVLMEVKEPNGQFYLRQLEFIASWKGYAAFVTTPDEARAVMSSPETKCLTAAEKTKIAGIALRARIESDKTLTAKGRRPLRNPQMRVTAFDKLMNQDALAALLIREPGKKSFQPNEVKGAIG